MDSHSRDYRFISYTTSLCSECLKKIDAKIIESDGKIYIIKNCPEHGQSRDILEENDEFYLKRGDYDKPGTISKTQTAVKNGCPFDCGLCPSHDQHTCNGLIEITNACDLGCPTCYANSGTGDFLSLEKINEMLDFFVDSEHGQAEILQISGGEPTMHPQILDIIRLARTKKIKYILLNTNGLRLARDEKLARDLGQFKGGFEIYLQFDGLSERSALNIRGRNVIQDRKKAVANLSKYRVPITLVATVVRGVNDSEIGDVFNYAVGEEWIRGINYQPVAFFGRLPEKADVKNRITMTGILKALEAQTKGMMKMADFIPLPCDVERVAISYLFKQKGKFIPLIRDIDIKQFLPAIRNTFQFAPDNVMKEIAETLDKRGGCCQIMNLFKNLQKTILPPNYLLMTHDQKAEFINNNTFRISATSFIDKYNFDAKSMQKECVHVITPDLKKIPFSAYNMIHRYKK